MYKKSFKIVKENVYCVNTYECSLSKMLYNIRSKCKLCYDCILNCNCNCCVYVLLQKSVYVVCLVHMLCVFCMCSIYVLSESLYPCLKYPLCVNKSPSGQSLAPLASSVKKKAKNKSLQILEGQRIENKEKKLFCSLLYVKMLLSICISKPLYNRSSSIF